MSTEGSHFEFQQMGPMAVLGAGSWGTALAIHLHNSGRDVRLWGRSVDKIESMRSTGLSPHYLPGVSLPQNMPLYSDIETCLEGVSDILVVVPSTDFAEVLHQIKSLVDQRDLRLAWATKGLDKVTHLPLSDVAAKIFSPSLPMAMLSGPSFAKEVAVGCLTAVSIAGNQTEWCQYLVQCFHSATFRAYLNDDFLGLQLCSVGKNVLAIAVGIVDGLELGANTRAALITRGMAELQRLLKSLGADANTILSLAGVGDIVLTCTDNQSRNRRFGLALGSGLTIRQAEAEVGHEIEGRNNVRQLHQLAAEHRVEMPIVQSMQAFLQGQVSLNDLMAQLARRPANTEFN